MHRDLHLDIGTRVINTADGRLGTVKEPHYMCRPTHDEICIHYDDMPEGSGINVDRAPLEYEGSPWFQSAMARFHPKPLAGEQQK